MTAGVLRAAIRAADDGIDRPVHVTVQAAGIRHLLSFPRQLPFWPCLPGRDTYRMTAAPVGKLARFKPRS